VTRSSLDPSHSSPRPSAFHEQEWDNGSWGIQQWLERTAWRTLKETSYGRRSASAAEHPALFEDPLLQKVYKLDLALFVGAERTSYLAVAGMIPFAPDEIAQMQLGTQVLDECRHYEVFCKRLADLGVTPAQREDLIRRHTTPSLRTFYDLILEQVDKRDFFAASIAQNLILEGMAYPVYRYEIRYWSRFDPGLTDTIRGAFADESHHVLFGEAINRTQLQRASLDERNRLRRLVADFAKLMTAGFNEIIRHYIGLYQACADQYMSEMGDIEIFPGRKLGDVTEEEQTRILLDEIQREHNERLARIGLD
jgi:hypothetical protein